METAVIFSGFGGQGALFVGQMLAYAAMEAGREVTWIPSYGPEMRGGTAHCTVVVGDETIGSPLVRSPDAVVAMNLPSVDRYEAALKPGGLIVYDSTIVDRSLVRSDVRCMALPAADIAARLGDGRLANMAMLGALCASTGIVTVEQAAATLRRHLPERHARLLEANLAALAEGAAWASREVEPHPVRSHTERA
jgi:2-oxoglutarate ferredoxin oxidoreductase subunit gamma